MSDQINYFIKIVDHKNNSESIVNKRVQLNNYSFYFSQIIDELIGSNTTMTSTLSNDGKAKVFEKESIISKGYFYNSTSEVDKLVYELSLVKIEEDLSNIFNDDKFSQTNFENVEEHKQEHQEVQTEDTEYVDKSTDPESNSEEEFGDFQGPEVFSNIDLNVPQTYPYYYPNVIVPEYTQPTYQNYTPYTYNYPSSNQFVGSSVPSYPTQPVQPVINTWSPELINELKFRLAQPNAGLNNTNYFL
jgi:hypothetical protein